MIAEFGHYCLVMALAIAILQASVPLYGAHRGDAAMMRLGDMTAIAQFIVVALSFAALTYAYVVSDFSVMNVAENSHTDKPMIYKISGVWGNHEGSLLLWITILAIFGLSLPVFGGHLPPGLKARALSVQAMVTIGFLLFILLTSNPFLRLDPAPVQGNGLNPLLQDPGLALHPPMLYLGYVGFSMAFSFAVAALIEGRVDPAWARWVRPWTLAAWASLTGGIALGSWWAYYELGWGGWWFWDPVENASFIPWLAGTALLHSVIVLEKRDALKSWTVFLALIAFALSLVGTFLVRSGVITSVHAFATDPTRGVFILGLLAVAIGGSFLLFAIRAPAMTGGNSFQPVSREGALLLNNLFMATAAGTVLLGTLYPIFADALELGRISVGAPFFNAVFVPLMTPVLIAMAAAPLMPWKSGDLPGAVAALRLALGLTVLAALATFALAGGTLDALMAGFGIALGVWIMAGTLTSLAEQVRLFGLPFRDSLSRARRTPRAHFAMILAHFGVGVMVLGITVSEYYSVEKIQLMQEGERVAVGPYTYTLARIESGRGPNYTFKRGVFEVARGDRRPIEIASETRHYLQRSGNPETTEAGIATNGLRDLYAVIGEQQRTANGTTGHVTRLHFKPGIPLLWWGAVLMTIGGLLAMTDRRGFVGEKTRRRAPTPKPGATKTAQPAAAGAE